MNKIIILGHPASGLEGVEALWVESGMQAARPSQRDGLLPQHITDTLCQAHGCAPVALAMSEDELAPQPVGPVWNGLALDLLMGNLQQQLWGWADARSIYWLDYWTGLDPHLTFVMVYNDPASALQASGVDLLSGKHGTPPDMAVSRLLENWQAYNGAMLQFYSRHPKRCLLVNAQRAREQLTDYLQALGSQLHPHTQAALTFNSSASSSATTEVNSRDAADLLSLAIKQGGGPQQLMTDWFGSSNVLEQQLLEQLLHHHPMALQIFQELEAAATVRGIQLNSAPAMHPGQAWIQLIEQRQAMASLTLSLYEQLVAQQQLTLGTQNQLVQLEQAKAQALKEREDLAKALKAAQAPVLPPPVPNELHKVKELEEENDLLLAQLHQVQEELERYYHENQNLKKNQTKPKSKPYGAAQRIQKQLSYRLGAAMITNSSSLGGWLRMPFALTGQVRAFRADRRAQVGQKLPPIHTYADAFEAKRIQQHLSYQLGQTLLKHGKTPWGWLWMPFAIVGTVRRFRKARAS